MTLCQEKWMQRLYSDKAGHGTVLPWSAVALIALCFAAHGALQGTTATFDTPGSVDGWASDNTRVTLSNPDSWLEMTFRAQYGPSMPETCRVFASTNTLGGALTGDFVKGGIAQINFNLMAVEAAPSAIWLTVLSGSGREGYLP